MKCIIMINLFNFLPLFFTTIIFLFSDKTPYSLSLSYLLSIILIVLLLTILIYFNFKKQLRIPKEINFEKIKIIKKYSFQIFLTFYYGNYN